MYIPDPIELGEARCERWAEDNMVNCSDFLCSCGKLCPLRDGETLSADPYAIPVCGACAEKYFKKMKEKNVDS